ncbi:MAG: hypothetical protein QOE92_8 [Chloroflexota bacterium]|jgi:hypothetical protein|nr:hypothetical protein [Chloroflexota bacterium]
MSGRRSRARRRLALALTAKPGALALTMLPAQVATAAATSVACADVAGLQTAITDANAASEATTITLAANCTYELTSGDTNGDGLPAISNTITIVGNGSTITRNSQDDFRIFAVAPEGDLTISNLTITNGSVVDGAEAYGGGIYNAGGTLLVTGSTISGNRVAATGNFATAASGGGIATTGNTTVINSKIFDNAATLTNTGSQLGAAGAAGGGIASKGGNLTVRTSTVSDNDVSATTNANLNSVSASGGGIVAKIGGPGNNSGPDGTVIVNTTTLSGNTVSASATGSSTASADAAGGGFAMNNLGNGESAPSLASKLVNNTISANVASRTGGSLTSAATGGGIALKGGNTGDTLDVVNNTVAGNTSDGGAVMQNGGGTLTLTNTIISSTDEDNCDGDVADGGNNISFPATDTSCANTFASGDPRLGPLAANGGPTKTMALLTGSTAIDTADAEACATALPDGAGGIDQRGEPRPETNGTACDVGAYEAQPVAAEAPAATEPPGLPAAGRLPDAPSGGDPWVILVPAATVAAAAAVGGARLRRRSRPAL